jgi:hypothetical protein
MDANIDFIDFSSEKLNAINFNPRNIFVNFFGKQNISSLDVPILAELIQKFNLSKIHFLNMSETVMNELRFIIEGYDNVGVLLR